MYSHQYVVRNTSYAGFLKQTLYGGSSMAAPPATCFSFLKTSFETRNVADENSLTTGGILPIALKKCQILVLLHEPFDRNFRIPFCL